MVRLVFDVDRFDFDVERLSFDVDTNCPIHKHTPTILEVLLIKKIVSSAYQMKLCR